MSNMDITFIVMLVLFVLWYVRHMNNHYQGKKFVYRMYELRDSLRDLAAQELIPEDEMFHYFDRSFCRAIKGHQYLNLYTLLYVWKKHKDEVKTQTNESVLRQYCKDHPALKQIYDAYRKTITNYIKGQHKFSFVLALTILKVATKTNRLTTSVSEAVKGLLVYPEFSESSNINLPSLRRANLH